MPLLVGLVTLGWMTFHSVETPVRSLLMKQYCVVIFTWVFRGVEKYFLGILKFHE